MNYSAAGIARSCLPRTFAAKNGLPVELHRLPAAAGQRLVDMYLAFQPRNSFQGLPPIKDAVCVRWVQDMLATGIHLTAMSPDDALIGHAALFPINTSKCELLVVVCPGFQNLGVGTQLVQSCVELAGELGFQQIWLPVDATNVRARCVYRKCGFEYVSDKRGHELDMTCNVRAGRPATIGTLHDADPSVPAPCFRFPELSLVVERN